MSKACSSALDRAFRTAGFKLNAMFGGMPVLITVYAVLLLCCLTVRSVISSSHASSISIACVDECNSALSQELIRQLSAEEGFDILQRSSYKEAEGLLTSGRAEAALLIHADYDNMLISDSSDDSSSIFTLTIAPYAASAELIREAVAGKMLAQRAYERVAAELRAEGYTDVEASLEYYLELFDENAPSLYTISAVGGGDKYQTPLFGRYFAGYAGFTALCLLLLGLTVSRWMTRTDSRMIAIRMGAVSNGAAIAFIGDYLALLFANLTACVIAAIAAPYMDAAFMLGLFAYAICLTGLMLLISRFGGMGRVDVAAPFIALSTSILGGCFIDITSVSHFMRVISLMVPQGQFIAVANGEWGYSVILLTEGVVFTVLASLYANRGVACKPMDRRDCVE